MRRSPHFPRRPGSKLRRVVRRRHRHCGPGGLDAEVISVTPVDAHRSRRLHARSAHPSPPAAVRLFDGVLRCQPASPDALLCQHSQRIAAGVQLHSSEYNSIQDLEGGRVLVVGAGNSGCDLTVDAAQHHLKVDIVIRGVQFQPKTYFGVSRQEVPFLTGFSPEEQDLLSRLLRSCPSARTTITPECLPRKRRRSQVAPPPSTTYCCIGSITDGSVRAGIGHFDRRTVHFTDGTCREYDSIWSGYQIQREAAALPRRGPNRPRRQESRATCGRHPARWRADLRESYRSRGPDPDLRRSNQVDCSDDQAL